MGIRGFGEVLISTRALEIYPNLTANKFGLTKKHFIHARREKVPQSVDKIEVPDMRPVG